MAEKVKEFKGGPGGRCRGPKSKVENPGIIMKRLFGMLFKSYGAVSYTHLDVYKRQE